MYTFVLAAVCDHLVVSCAHRSSLSLIALWIALCMDCDIHVCASVYWRCRMHATKSSWLG